MKTPFVKVLGLALVLGSIALFAWIAYEPANVASALLVQGAIDEAAIVLMALAFSVVSFGVGSVLLFRPRARFQKAIS
jgi:hypothetical protein